MINKKIIKAIAFDCGGTLDSPFLHWMDIYIKIYTEQLGLALNRDNFLNAYVYAERKMEKEQPVKCHHSLFETQLFKIKYQFEFIQENAILALDADDVDALVIKAAQLITDYSAMNVATAKPILENLAKRYTLLLVSNYYGNVAKVIEDMQIAHLFVSVTDSAVESIRKPDARLWQIAIERQGFKPEDVLIVGDSKKNDILPGLAIGAQVVQGVPADVELPKEYQAIKHLDELKGLLS